MTSSGGPSIKNSIANEASLQNWEIKHPPRNEGTDPDPGRPPLQDVPKELFELELKTRQQLEST